MKFSDAISSIWPRCRSSSRPSSAATSGSCTASPPVRRRSNCSAATATGGNANSRAPGHVGLRPARPTGRRLAAGRGARGPARATENHVGGAVARGDVVVSGAAQHAVAAASRPEVVIARAAHEDVVLPEPDQHVGAAQAADHVAAPCSDEPVPPVRPDDRAPEETPTVVARPRGRAERGSRTGGRAGGARRDDAESVALSGHQPGEPERDGRRRARAGSRTAAVRAVSAPPRPNSTQTCVSSPPEATSARISARASEIPEALARPIVGCPPSGRRRLRPGSSRPSSGRRGARGTRCRV